MPEALQPESFDDYYNRVYKGQHFNKLNRICHILGTVTAVAGVVAGLVSTFSSSSDDSSSSTKKILYPVGGIAVGYGLMTIGHLFFEKNLPKPFKTPAWTFQANLRSCYETVLGYNN